MPAGQQDRLPIPDYDHLRIGDLESRIRSLTQQQLHELLHHERTHAGRILVISLLERRVEALESGAEPTGGDPAAEVPGAPPAPDPATSKASPQTEGPVVNPPSHGDPTNPSQPRT